MSALADRDLLSWALREDLVSFIHRSFMSIAPGTPFHANWHIEAIAWHLTQCLTGEIKRLIITLPPRNLKSICASVAFPAWALGRDPRRKIICASYAQDLAAKHSRDCRAVMDSDWFRAIFPGTRLDPAKSAEAEFTTTRRGFRMATSVGGTLTGRGGDIILIDDPLKPTEAMSDLKRGAVGDWYRNTLYARLDDKRTGVIVIIMQRLHMDDLVGRVLETEEWVHLNLPAIADKPQRIALGPDDWYERRAGALLHPAREPQSVLDQMRANLGSATFAAQYQQQPVPTEGALVKWAWFAIYAMPPEKTSNDWIVQSWDTASKIGEFNDYSVCTTWLVQERGSATPTCYLLDVVRVRLEFPELKRRIAAHAAAVPDGVDAVLIEDKGSGTPLIQDLKRERRVPVIACLPEGDKVTRLHGQTPRIEAGQVLLPAQAPWLDDFRAEVLAFPGGRHDDQVDSLAQFLVWLANWPVFVAPRIRSL